MKENVLREKSCAFAVRIVKFSRFLREQKIEWSINNQILRSGTSVAANIEEANASISKKEFSAKISIAFKEAREVRFWLVLLKDTEPKIKDHLEILTMEIEDILRILWVILKKTRINTNEEMRK